MNPNGTNEAGFVPLAGIAADSSDTDQRNRAAVGSDLTTSSMMCTIWYMTARRKKHRTITETLRQAICDSELSFKALERETGVVRQSLMKFARGERSLRLDMADRLAKYFDLEVTQRKGK